MAKKLPEPNLHRLHFSRRFRVQIWSLILRSAALLVLILAASLPSTGARAQTRVGPKAYYLALGDSLAYGTQPGYPPTYGYADQWFKELQTRGVQSLVDFGCMGESTSTMIFGGCTWGWFKRTPYTGPQLSAALRFIRSHPGQVSPVSIDIGVIDGLRATWPPRSCNVVPSWWEWQLAKVDANLTQTILPRLVEALTDSSGNRTGDLVMVNYYDPAQNECPEVDHYFQELNAHLAADAAKFDIPVADIYSQFNPGPVPTETLCEYTWMCEENDVHPTGGQPGVPGNGYGVIAHVIEQTLGY